MDLKPMMTYSADVLFELPSTSSKLLLSGRSSSNICLFCCSTKKCLF